MKWLIPPSSFLVTCVLILIAEVQDINCSRILCIFPTPCRSHQAVFNSLTQELARRGHELVVVTPFPLITPPSLNYTQIDLMPSIKNYFHEVLSLDLYSYQNPIYFPFFYWSKSFNMLEMMFSNTQLRDLKYDRKGFDLVICEDVLTEALCAFADYFKAPKVLISSLGGFHWTNYAVGNPLEPSYVPNVLLPYSDRMNFGERFINLIYSTLWNIGDHLYYYPRQETLRKELFGNTTRSLWDLKHTTSLVLLNNHFSLNYPRPLLPNMIEVGGLHVKRAPDDLPQDIQKFLDDSPQGVIYFSMGSNLRSDAMSSEKLNALLKAFSELPQKVLMKWESDFLPGKPKNVKVAKWLPQQDILAHKNVRLFLTHGGLLSAQEAAYHGIPLVGIPIYSDQRLNIHKAKDAGYAIVLELNKLTKQSILRALKTALNDHSLRTEAVRRSAMFRDQPDSPMERAVFWTEYVIRHGGAPQLQSASVHLSWYQRHFLDVFITLIVISMITVKLITILITRRYDGTEKFIATLRYYLERYSIEFYTTQEIKNKNYTQVDENNNYNDKKIT